MRLTFDRDLLETAWLLLSPGTDLEREAIYEIEDEQERETAFQAHVAAWFRKSGIESRFRAAFENYTCLLQACPVAIIRRVRNPADEIGELFRNEQGINRIGIGMRSGRIGDGSFDSFLRHELCHINDMLDPSFGYPGPTVDACGTDGQVRRDRYGLLWDITIDARLSRRPSVADHFRRAVDRHRARFDSMFGFCPEPERAEIFAELSRTDKPTHVRLWAIASDPRRVKSAAGPTPGGRCPVCGFTTFEWADADRVARAAPAILAEFPDWGRDTGCCGRCAELYAAFDVNRVPATVLLPNQQRSRILAARH